MNYVKHEDTRPGARAGAAARGAHATACSTTAHLFASKIGVRRPESLKQCLAELSVAPRVEDLLKSAFDRARASRAEFRDVQVQRSDAGHAILERSRRQ